MILPSIRCFNCLLQNHSIAVGNSPLGCCEIQKSVLNQCGFIHRLASDQINDRFLSNIRFCRTLRLLKVFFFFNVSAILCFVGGTLDVTVHQIQENGTIKEIHKATGGPFGGQKVNKQFIGLLGKIFSQKFIENYIRQNPVDWLYLINDFEVKKRGKRVCEGGTTRIRLPGSFVGKFSGDKGWDINAMIQERYSLDDIKVQRNEYLCLEPKIMRQLFEPVLDDIVAHLSNLFAKQELTEVETVFLVGGFADSLILQERIKRQFCNSYRIVVPPNASFAVVQGAVMYGQKPEVFESRIMSYTYGIRIHKYFLDGLHPESKKEVVNGVPRCKDAFFKFVKVNEVVRDGERRRFQGFSPLKGAEKQIRIDFYRSERADAEFVTDFGVEKVPGRGLVLETPEAWKTRDIEFNLFFGGTEIKVTAVNLTSNTESTASIDFLATN